MKKIVLLFVGFVFSVAFSGPVFSECWTTQNTLFFVDLETLLTTERVLTISQAQAMPLIMKNIQEGKIISASPGLKVRKLETINEYLMVVESGNYPYIVFREHIKCR